MEGCAPATKAGERLPAPLNRLPWDLAKDEFGGQATDFLGVMGALLVRAAKDQIRLHLTDPTRLPGALSPPPGNDQCLPAACDWRRGRFGWPTGGPKSCQTLPGLRKSIPLRRDPETLFPGSANWNHLEFLVDPLLRQVQRVRDADHRLECDEALGRWISCTRCRRDGGRGDLHALRGVHRGLDRRPR